MGKKNSHRKTWPIKMEDSSTDVDRKDSKLFFQSDELELLLDMIDGLRLQGISRFIDLPQMIVCGDQSSGKSSVLEAVSGVRFPTKDNLCTRFPTELILRRSPEENTSITIIPDASRSDDEKKKLQDFKAGPESLDNFGEIVDAAGKAMGLDQSTKVFSNDVLRVELTGPKLPHLTLVDLPGLFHAGNKSQSASDADAVKKLVNTYMSKSRSIILAVVSAKNDYANQIVTKYACDVDPEGERTLGIITKPDTLNAGSESEKQFFELAQNKDVVLRLGWHVLKNRDFDTKDCSAEERDQSEAAFFSRGIWQSMMPTQMGIGTLKPRLSRVLKDQILVELPHLIEDVEAGIADCEGRLERLGGPRVTPFEQRAYLHLVSQNFCKLVRNAVLGQYHEDYFGSGDTKAGYAKRIRAVVYNHLDEFEAEMNENGHKYQVADVEPDEPQHNKFPMLITKEERLLQIGELIRLNRGSELPGFSKHETITLLFKEQCSPWSSIVTKYAQKIFNAVRSSLYQVLDNTTDENTSGGIRRFMINPILDDIKAKLDLAVARNLKQHVSGQPITFNHYFIENIQKLREQHQVEHLQDRLYAYFGQAEYKTNATIASTFNVKDLANALAQSTEKDNFTFTCSEALYYMQAYYKVALKFFVDDFSIHTIEQGLLEKLEGILDPSKILTLEDTTIEDIAGETEESKIERQSSTTKLEALRKALDALHRLDRGRPAVSRKHEAN